jgi:dihydrofolate reductase/thymidylate synthase
MNNPTYRQNPGFPKKMKNFSVVVAVTQKGGIGLNATIPWKLPTDLKFFKSVTTKTQDEKKQNAVIMGRKTWDSIPAKFRPLPGRLNIVLTRNIQEHISACSNSNVRFASTFQQALEVADDTDVEGVFVIGGSHVYKECLSSPLCSKIYLTQVLRDINCDVFFPPLNPSEFRLETVGEVQVENSVPFQFNTYIRTESDTNSLPISTDVAPVENVEEMQYLDLVRRVIDTGVHKGDRTGTGTLSLFGIQSRYNLRGGRMPLLTTKRVFWRGVVEELLWLIRGCTDSKQLAEKKVSIWDGNGSRAFLDKLGFTARAEGDLGPVYGFQWRHFGAEYTTCSGNV